MSTGTHANHALARQSAFIRALADEVDRYPASHVRAVALRAQLREEEARLAHSMASASPAGRLSFTSRG